MVQTTKSRILEHALQLFAQKGYQAVSVAHIAKAVGIKAPSLYKHYAGKQDVFDAIVKEMSVRYEQQMQSMNMDGVDASMDEKLFSQITEKQLIAMGKQLFTFFLHDFYASNFRKLLRIERYHDSSLSAIYTKQYIIEPLAYQKQLFAFIVQGGLLQCDDLDLMAMDFYSPLYLLLDLCDTNPDKESYALQMIERHIQCFNKSYRRKEETENE